MKIMWYTHYMKTCKYDDCDGQHYGRGYCELHYKRLIYSGELESRPRLVGDERFWSKVDVEHPLRCWEWTAYVNAGGYGQFRVGDAMVLAHRVAYEMLVGPIPEGLQIDHLCRVRHCVNPDHLEPVTMYENQLRGATWKRKRAQSLITHCPHGHEYNEENTAIKKDGSRYCRACRNARQRTPEARAYKAAWERERKKREQSDGMCTG